MRSLAFWFWQRVKSEAFSFACFNWLCGLGRTAAKLLVTCTHMDLQRGISQAAHTCWRQHQNSVALDQLQNRSRHLRLLKLRHNVLISKGERNGAIPSSNASRSLSTVESRVSFVVMLRCAMIVQAPHSICGSCEVEHLFMIAFGRTCAVVLPDVSTAFTSVVAD